MSRTLLPGPALAAARAVLRSRPAAVVLVDGRSGSGKSTVASALVRSTGAALLRLDDVYPGWDGLEAAAAALVERVLLPRSAGAAGRVRGWDWRAGAPGPERVVPPVRPLVVEGCGAITRASAPFAGLALWLDLDARTRRRRALARDGDAFRLHWARWARQEALLLAREGSATLADVRVDTRDLRAADAPDPVGSLPG